MKKIFLIALCTVAISGCDSWKKKEPPLPGTRVSVLQHERSVTADAEVANTEIVLPAPTPNTEWPQSGGYANHAMHHVQVGDALREVWSVDIGTGASDEERLGGEPIVAGGLVYTIDARSKVSAYNEKTGKRAWRVDLTPEFDDDGHINGGLAVSDGRLFVTTGFAQVIALEAPTGKELWRITLDAPLRAAPSVRGGRVFALTLNNKLFALDAETGKELWTHLGLPETASILGGASPAIDQGVVVVPYTSGQLVALRVDTGRLVWEESLAAVRRTDVISTLADIRGRPIIDRNRVIAMSHGGQIVSIDLRTGRRIWDRDIGGLESPWVAGDYIFALTNDAEVICLSRNDGRVYWVQGLPRFENPEDLADPITWTGPILASDRLIVAGSNGEALAVSPYSGKVLGVVKMPDRVSVPPIVANGSVFFLADDARLVAYR
ncbi:MAG: PQQ-binding-like beta-propeller repeat protein [Rhodospirillales bacterium]|nr:PQQ-binding-like beta-propeller repeat protein [Rhodospirillales bacterium]